MLNSIKPLRTAQQLASSELYRNKFKGCHLIFLNLLNVYVLNDYFEICLHSNSLICLDLYKSSETKSTEIKRFPPDKIFMKEIALALRVSPFSCHCPFQFVFDMDAEDNMIYKFNTSIALARLRPFSRKFDKSFLRWKIEGIIGARSANTFTKNFRIK